MARYRGLARELGLWISLGGFQERGPDPEHTHNTHVVLDASGATVAAYRKARAPSPLHEGHPLGRHSGRALARLPGVVWC